jgi:flagellum-specific peptidoglycan hydrolase FlgJ
MNGIFKIFLFSAAVIFITGSCGVFRQEYEQLKTTSYLGQTDKKFTPSEYYVFTYRDMAVKEMERTGIPASISLAQGMLESGCGGSYLSRVARNHFGIKCHNDWTGERIYLNDDEENECFRKYACVEGAYRDHSDFLRSNPRYWKLFELDIYDYKGWAEGLKRAGYATSPDYDRLLISIIDKYQLHLYDRLADLDKIGLDDRDGTGTRSTEYLNSEESMPWLRD